MDYSEALELLKRIINESNNEQSVKNTMNNLIEMLDIRARKIDYIRSFIRLKCYDNEIKCCVHDLISNDCDKLLQILQENSKVGDYNEKSNC